MTIYSGKSRSLLKTLLWDSRGHFSALYGRVPTCPLCSLPIASPAECDLHEALLTRRDVQNTKNPDVIMTSLNCVLVHHTCHMQIAGHGGDEIWEKCARNIAKWEGHSLVYEWLKEIVRRFPTAARAVLWRFEAIDFSRDSQ